MFFSSVVNRIRMPLVKFFFRFTIILILTINSGCTFFFKNSGPLPIAVSTSSFLLAWDVDNESLTDLPSSTRYFNIYYRELFAKDWILLKSTNGNISSITVNDHEIEGSGNYEIGVEQVYKSGRTSEIHGSTDFSAKPAGGWYIVVSNP